MVTIEGFEGRNVGKLWFFLWNMSNISILFGENVGKASVWTHLSCICLLQKYKTIVGFYPGRACRCSRHARFWSRLISWDCSVLYVERRNSWPTYKGVAFKSSSCILSRGRSGHRTA
jgi:hypothetical protein